MNDSNDHPTIGKGTTQIVFVAVLILALCIGCFLFGRISSSTRELEVAMTIPSDESGQKLYISAIVDRDANIYKFSPKELSANFEQVTYHDLSNVEIKLDSTIMPLDEALLGHNITIPELTAWARMDAHDKYCVETMESKNGLTKFVYSYKEFDLHIIYDIYETPDGQQHLIQSVDLFPPNSGTGMDFFFTNEDGSLIDRENWGLSFEVVETCPSGITFNIIQSGGQQLGELRTSLYLLDSKNEEKSVGRGIQEVIIEKDSTTTVTLDWTKEYGELPGGTYILSFEVCDNFDEELVHSLMRNFHDRQYYGFEFTIP